MGLKQKNKRLKLQEEAKHVESEEEREDSESESEEEEESEESQNENENENESESGSGSEESEEEGSNDEDDEDEEDEEDGDDEEEEETDDSHERTVFVSGISYSSTEKDIQEFFAKCGKINDIRMPKYQDSGKIMGYAHIEFGKKEEAAKACKLNKQMLHNRYLDVQLSKPKNAKQFPNPKGRPDGTTTIFVKNLPYSTEEKDMEKLFKRYGEIKNIRFGIDNGTGRMKGFAFVEFGNEESTFKAKEMNGKMFQGRKLLVDYDYGRQRASYKGAKWSQKGERS